jgi:Family of unknown function (DUF6998)
VENRIEPDWRRIDEVPRLVARLYEVVDALEDIFPGRHFTPDGHLVGSLGESLAAYVFGVTLNKASTTGHDALLGDRTIEVKATQRSSVAISADDRCPDLLVVFRFDRHQRPELVYNGPARRAWELAGRPQRNGQRQLNLNRLRKLNLEVEAGERLPETRSLADIEWPDG